MHFFKKGDIIMSRLEKEIEKLKSKPKDYTYDEAKTLSNKRYYRKIERRENDLNE